MTGNFSLINYEEQCVFYNEEYEKELLSAVGLSPSDPCHFLRDSRDIEKLLPSVDGHVVDYSQLQPNPDDYMPEPKKKRGRPMKAESNSKMAAYSRQYREGKKQELAESLQRATQLVRENEELRLQLQAAVKYSHQLYNYIQSQQMSAYWPRSAPNTPTKHHF